MTSEERERLARRYADMSDDELAELNMRRDSLVREARDIFDTEARARRENIAQLTDEKFEEDFRDKASRWNDDDLLHFLHSQTALTPAQQRVVHDEVHRRDLDTRTLPPADTLQLTRNEDESVVVGRYETQGEAAVVKSLLESCGIPAEWQPPSGMRLTPNPLRKGVAVWTLARYLDDARAILNSASQESS